MGIKIEYMPYSDTQLLAQALQDGGLEILCFNVSKPNCPNEVPKIHLNTPVLAGEEIACGLWLSDISSENTISIHVVSSKKGMIQFQLNNALLFGVTGLDELVFSQGQSQQEENAISPLHQATESAYRQTFTLIYELGLPNGPLSIAFLVGKTAAVAIENSRQIKVYGYPEEYGLLAPSFLCVALLKSGNLHVGNQAILLISGTASIVDNQTQHALDVAAQTGESLLHLETVIEQANCNRRQPRFNLHYSFLRASIRHAADLDGLRGELQNNLKGKFNAIFLLADICRHELLVEIEAIIQSFAGLA